MYASLVVEAVEKLLLLLMDGCQEDRDTPPVNIMLTGKPVDDDDDDDDDDNRPVISVL